MKYCIIKPSGYLLPILLLVACQNKAQKEAAEIASQSTDFITTSCWLTAQNGWGSPNHVFTQQKAAEIEKMKCNTLIM